MYRNFQYFYLYIINVEDPEIAPVQQGENVISLESCQTSQPTFF